MAPRGGSTGGSGAVAALKETLVRQFGAGTREIVEAEVEGRIATTGGRLGRDDLDAIERTVLAAKRQQRGAAPKHAHAPTPVMPRQRSSPELIGAGAVAARLPISSPSPAPKAVGSRASAVGTPLSRAASQSGALGLGGSTSGTQGLTAAHLAQSASTQPLRKAPFATTIGADVDDTQSERSRVIVRPRYPVPMKPKLKPMDHWDMIVAFDAAKFVQEEEEFQRKGRHDKIGRFRATLDGQMDEMRDLREQEAEAKRQEMADMTAQIEENKRLNQCEHDKEQDQKNKMIKANDAATVSINRRNQKQKDKKDKEQRDMLNWMESERIRQETEKKEQAEEYDRKCKKAREEMEEVLRENERRRKERLETEMKEMGDAQKAMDAAEAGGRQAVADRMARNEELSRVFGAVIEKRDREEAELLEARIKKVQEDGERLAKEDFERRKSEHDRRVKDMLNIRAKQVKEKSEQGLVEIVAGKKQAQIFREQLATNEIEEQGKIEKRRKAREDLDNHLVSQMSANLSVHPLQFGITDKIRKQELSYNRVLFEQMATDGFKEELMGGFLGNASDKGRLIQYGSVGPTDMPIHELETKEADV